jgi:hypothetical protein
MVDVLELVRILDELGLEDGDLCVDVLDLILLVLDDVEEIEEVEPVRGELLEMAFEDELAMDEEATIGLEDILETTEEIDVLEMTDEIDVITLLILLVTLSSRCPDIRTCLEWQS